MTNIQEATDIKTIGLIVNLLKKCTEDPKIADALEKYIDELLGNCVTLKITRSSKLNLLFSSLIKAQGEMPVAGKESKSNYGKYADLRSVVESSRPILGKNDLCVFHIFSPESDGQYLIAVLGHSSGQHITSKIKISPPNNNIHAMGSYITYMKRYTYAAITGVITGDVDDDGESAMKADEETKKNIISGKSISPDEYILTTEQISIIRNLIGSRTEIADRITKKYGVNTLLQIKQKHFDDIIKGLEAINKTQNHTNGANHAK